MIKAENLFLSYDNKKNIIKESQFTIDEREFVFIGGQSGSGKSTLLKALYGDVEVKYGNLFVNDLNLKNVSRSKLQNLRKSIGIVFQDYKLVNEWTIEENIMLPLRINGHRDEVCKDQADKLLKHIKLQHKKGSFPQELSGGEQQRIAVARAIAHNPKLILADEPTGNLDEYSAELVWDLLKGAKEALGVTVIVVTHRVPKNFGIRTRQLSISDGSIYEVS